VRRFFLLCLRVCTFQYRYIITADHALPVLYTHSMRICFSALLCCISRVCVHGRPEGWPPPMGGLLQCACSFAQNCQVGATRYGEPFMLTSFAVNSLRSCVPALSQVVGDCNGKLVRQDSATGCLVMARVERGRRLHPAVLLISFVSKSLCSACL
jgi:hypothetical protein